MQKSKLIASIAIAATAAAAVPGTSLAGDSKILPGMNCKPANHTDEAKVNYFGGGIFNVSSANVEVRCPVIRDNTGNSDGMVGGTGGVYVRISKAPAGVTQNVTCKATAYAAFSSGVIDSATQTLNVSSAKLFDLRIDRSEPGGAYEVGCILPPSFQIVNYQGTD